MLGKEGILLALRRDWRASHLTVEQLREWSCCGRPGCLCQCIVQGALACRNWQLGIRYAPIAASISSRLFTLFIVFSSSLGALLDHILRFN